MRLRLCLVQSSAPYAAAWVLACSVGFSQDAVELFHRMQHALGGAENIAGIADFEQTVQAETWNNRGQRIGEVRKRVRWIRGDHLRLDQAGPGDTYALYFNGSSGWEILPNRQFAELAGGELEFARKYLADFILNVWLADRLAGYSISTPARDVIRVSVNNNAREQIDITLDPATALPEKEASVSLADPGHPVPSETQIRSWTTVRGVRFPEKISVLHGGVRLADITTVEIKINGGLRFEDLARKPADLKPELATH